MPSGVPRLTSNTPVLAWRGHVGWSDGYGLTDMPITLFINNYFIYDLLVRSRSSHSVSIAGKFAKLAILRNLGIFSIRMHARRVYFLHSRGKSLNECLNHLISVKRPRCNAQTLCSTWHSWVIDWLNI